MNDIYINIAYVYCITYYSIIISIKLLLRLFESVKFVVIIDEVKFNLYCTSTVQLYKGVRNCFLTVGYTFFSNIVFYKFITVQYLPK